MEKVLNKNGSEVDVVSAIPVTLQTITTTNQLIPMTSSVTATGDIVNWSYTNSSTKNQKINFTLRGEIKRKLAVGFSGQAFYSDGVELYGISGFTSQAIYNGRDNVTENFNSSVPPVTGGTEKSRTCQVGMIGIVAPGDTVTIKARAYGQHTSGLDTTATADNTTFFCDSFAEIMTL